MRIFVKSLVASFLLVAACGGASAPAETASPRAGAAGTEPPDGYPGKALADSQVYDEAGQAKACEAPKPSCPDRPRPVEFLDRCRLAGYQVRKCGCEELCGGRVKVDKKHYDAQGNAKDCAPETRDCSPPETSASFQDACNEHGHKLVVCGCEWLCTGQPR